MKGPLLVRCFGVLRTLVFQNRVIKATVPRTRRLLDAALERHPISCVLFADRRCRCDTCVFRMVALRHRMALGLMFGDTSCLLSSCLQRDVRRGRCGHCDRAGCRRRGRRGHCRATRARLSSSSQRKHRERDGRDTLIKHPSVHIDLHGMVKCYFDDSNPFKCAPA